jgi:hypothetical protein
MSGINLGYWKGDRGCLMVTWSPLVNMIGLHLLPKWSSTRLLFGCACISFPLLAWGRRFGIKIGSSVGLVEEIDIFDDEVGWGEYLRICVLLDLQKPLARGRKLHFQNKSTWVAFKYEKLPEFCFTCGVIKHGV